MHTPLPLIAHRILSTLACGTLLVACGGGSNSDETVLLGATKSTTANQTRPLNAPTATGTININPSPAPASSVLVAGALITDVRFDTSDAKDTQTNLPVTFGQVFALGQLKPAAGLTGRLDDGTMVPLQIDVKATHADGSVRHAVISGVIPKLAAGVERKMDLLNGGITATPTMTPSVLLGAGFSASVQATIGNVAYSASADDLLKNKTAAKWLSGAVVNEWHVSTPLKTVSGVEHPHLTARFNIRWYEAIKKARVDVTVENNWAYEPSPQNFVYNADVKVGGKSVYTKAPLTHLHHARWRKLFWWGGDAPQLNVKLNTNYLIASRALPNYDQNLVAPESTLKGLAASFTGAATEPMAVGIVNPYMPSTGGRDEIGLLPGWAVTYLLTMDKRARDVTLGTADLAGSWSAHYRDKKTDRPVSLMNYPYMTLLGTPGDTYNPATRQQEYFPRCGGDCSTPNFHDNSHQPGFAYLPYMVTGDYYYLEEMQFWAMWNLFSSNPGYRQNIKGLLIPEQVRGQAWGLRTLSQAAYITPDNDPLKSDLTTLLNNNLDWYNANYTDNAAANKLGVLINGYAVVYNGSTGVAPWQDDFFTAAVGHTAELGFDKARSLLAWKAKFPVERMVAPGTCWVDGAIYALTIRNSESSPIYATMAEAYRASHTAEFNALSCGSAAMASSLGLQVGQMTGYSDGYMGYPSNMQPALAYAADVPGSAGKQAWAVFMSRSVKPDYSVSPQFAIVPR